MARDDRGDGSGDGSSGGTKGKKGKHPKHTRQASGRHPKGRHGGHDGHRGHRGSGRGHNPRVVHPGTFHEAAGAGSIGHTSGANPGGGPAQQGHPAGSGMAAHVIRPPLSTGLGDVLLELVGEGTITLGAALGAWQRDQERVTNRAWRRPGGLARMGGL